MSSLARGTGIEIYTVPEQECPQVRRPSHEGRGLKCVSLARCCPVNASSLARGTGIEIRAHLGLLCGYRVVPRTRDGD